MQARPGICWASDTTVGNIAVVTPLIHGHFPHAQGADGVLACDLVTAGKYRNGAARKWCRTHQTYWGVKTDLAALALHGQPRCARHAEAMHYALQPPVLDMSGAGHLTIHYSAGSAVAIACDPAGPLFEGTGIVQLNLTPPAVLAYLEARRAQLPLGCLYCARCRHPHLDLGLFATQAHRRHYCGNCGNDSTHSADAIVSSPLHALSMFCGDKIRFS